MKELKEQPFIVFMLACSGWTLEQLNTQPEHIIIGALFAIQEFKDNVFAECTASDLAQAGKVTMEYCGETPVNYPEPGPPKRSKFAERLEQVQRDQIEQRTAAPYKPSVYEACYCNEMMETCPYCKNKQS